MSAVADGRLRILSRTDLAAIAIDPAEVVAIVERAYLALADGRSDNPRKLTTKPADGRSVAYAMLGRDGAGELVGVKSSYKHGLGDDRDAQRYYTALQLYDDRSGRPIALLDCARIGALRTPAVTALLARACARPDARTALVIGTGTQGRNALPFLLATLDGLEEILVFGTHPAGLRAVAELAEPHLDGRRLRFVDDPRAAAEEADVVVGAAGPATSAAVEIADLRPGAVSVLVGYGLAPSMLHGADRVVATSAAQMAVTGTDMADADGALPPVDAELPDILAGCASGRTSDDQRVFAYNSGLVLTDIALGRHFAERAAADGLGTEVELWA